MKIESTVDCRNHGPPLSAPDGAYRATRRSRRLRRSGLCHAKILIIDGDPDVRGFLSESLATLGLKPS